MLKLFKSFQPSMAIVMGISSIALSASVQANPSPVNDSLQASQVIANGNTPIRRYGSGHVALESKIDTVSGAAELALAEHLVKIGAKFYGAHWCSHCQKQKSLFGATAATKLPYIECATDVVTPQLQLCREAKIQMFPTWVINGQKLPGTRELKDIATATGYTGPMDFKYHK